ncbi:TRAP transporter substrate-binding protein [Amphritea pacifica]|uniref:TRAP transporter substrate-binding protein n=1 Tax=Amphritea pacifica TaxID=2811233 RepID=A0ABS2WC30_9GAMM|nr:TRAP transporter substrate-binding protein [Amphritea pacifica]MBN0989244.1 TRAP transporter substrate-binding protein [Amphritea pacifica]MBN1007282.1 TRAP transporter substrate-binding protein [Amphritea pacifica]
MFIIKKVKSLTLIALLMGLSNIAAAETIMRVASWLPPTHVQNAVVWPTWGKWIEEATEGRVKLEIEYGLGHPKTLFELVEDGVADASFSYHGYVPGRFKLALGVEEPLMGASAEAASVAYWRVHQKYFAAANEHDGLTVAGVFVHGPGQIQTIEPISSLADLKGKKIRIGGGVPAEIGNRLGVTPVGAPAPKVYELLQQGIVDGVFLPIAEQKTLRLNEVARNVVALPGGMYLGSFSIFINPDFLDSLSDKDREAIMSVSGEKLSAMAGRAWDAADREGMKAAEEAGVNIVKVSADDAFAKDFNQLVEGMDQIWLDSVADRDVDAKSALAELRSIAHSYHE